MSGVFCAIDTPDLDKALALVRLLAPEKTGFKLGLEFFAAHGLSGVMKVREAMGSAPFFLDLKFHDIPNTVAGAVSSVLPARPDFLTVHASGGSDMLRSACEAAGKAVGSRPPVLLAVTVLTHMDDHALLAAGQKGPVAEQVLRLAALAVQSGIGGLVSSPREVASLRAGFGPGLVLVVPGIRPAGTGADDQKRTLEPAEAVAAGADFLVIGRPITAARDPLQALRAILDSISAPVSVMKMKEQA